MAVVIGSNIGALSAARQLSDSSTSLSRALERLASGQRINHASDDAAGLSIASALTSNSRVFAKALQNLNDGLSTLSVAEGAISSLSNIVTRQKELAQEAANGTYSTAQRQALDREATALTNEYNRIIDTTSMNGRLLLNGDTNSLSIQAGFGAQNALSISLGQYLATGSSQVSGVNLSVPITGQQQITSFDFSGVTVSDASVTFGGAIPVGGGPETSKFLLHGIDDVGPYGTVAYGSYGSHAASWDGIEFNLSTTGGNYDVFLHMNGSGTTQQGTGTLIEVDFDSTDSLATISNNLANAIGSAVGGAAGVTYGYANGDYYITVADTSNGNVTNVGSVFAYHNSHFATWTNPEGSSPASPMSAGSYVRFTDNNTAGAGTPFAVWYTVNGSGSAPVLPGVTLYQVNILTTDNASAVATKTATVLNANGKTATANGHGAGTLEVGYSGYTVSYLSNNGANITGNTNYSAGGNRIAPSSYIKVYDGSNNPYYFWFKVGGSGADPGAGGTGIQVNITSSNTIAQVLAAIQAVAPGGSFTTGTAGNSIQFTNVAVGAANSPTQSNAGVTPSTTQTGQNPPISVAGDTITYTSHGLNTGDAVTVSSSLTLPNPLSAATTYYAIKVDANTFKLATSLANAQSSTAIDLTSAGTGTLTFTSSGSGSTADYHASAISLLSVSSARSALDTLTTISQQIALEIGSVGSMESRLAVAAAVVGEMRLNYTAAAGRISDADTSAEISNYTRLSILQQSGAAVLAQANIQPKIALKLLGSG